MEDLTRQWNGLSLSNWEGPKFRLKKDLATTEFLLTAKFFTKKALNTDAIAATSKPLWRAKNGFKVKNIGNHLVLFTLDNKNTIENILSNEPWSFDKHVVALQQ